MPKTSARLLLLLSLLTARRVWPGRLLAERLDVSPRTLRRDVDQLRALGYPVVAVKGPDGGYGLESGTGLPPLLFDDEQAVALSVALRLAAGTGADIEDGAARALATVRQVMPDRLRRRIDGFEALAVTRPRGPGDGSAGIAVLTTLGGVVRAREVLRFDYRPASSPGSGKRGGHDDSWPRRVEPHHLVARGGRWYLVAWDLEREDWRLFRADRITPRAPTGPVFTPRALPGGDVTTFVNGRFRGSDGSGEWPCRGEVIVDLPAAEVSRHARDAVVEEFGPDRCRVVLGSWSWTSLAASACLFDADFEVVGPPRLRAACAALARRCGDAAGGRVATGRGDGRQI